MIKILFVCHGNICRSTMAESVFTWLLHQAHDEQEFHIDSAATSREEIGNGVHHGTRKKLREEHIPVVEHRARQMTALDGERFDYLIGMDEENIRNMKRIVTPSAHKKIFKLLDFSERKGNIADPWYTGNFDETFQDVMEGCLALYEKLRKQS